MRTHERVSITRNGKPAAVLISAEDLEALEETLYWASQDRLSEDGEPVDAAAVLADLRVRKDSPSSAADGHMTLLGGAIVQVSAL